MCVLNLDSFVNYYVRTDIGIVGERGNFDYNTKISTSDQNGPFCDL